MDLSTQLSNGNNMNFVNSLNYNNIKSIVTSPVANIHNSNTNNSAPNVNNHSNQIFLNPTIRVVHQKRQIVSHFGVNSQQSRAVIAGRIGGNHITSTSLNSTSSQSSSTPPTSPASSTNVAINTINTGSCYDQRDNRIPNNLSASMSGCIATNNNCSDSDISPSTNVTILADRYLVLNQIAGSSFYECVDVRTGESLTCKAIGNSYSKILSAYFRLDGDPHVKQLHKLLQGTDQTYLLLPPSQFGDLHSFVRERKRLREPEARHLFRQICKTVKSCHDQGIVLRDLKLRKFVFNDCNRTSLKFESLEDAVVLDNPEDDILKEKIGCPAYVAPEILKPNSDFSGKAADLWSLGVILYTMLVGRYPFNDPEHSSLFAKIARCQFTIPDYISPKARCLIKSLLQKVPKHRLTSDDVLYHYWLLEEDTTNIHGDSNNSSSINLLSSISSINSNCTSSSNNLDLSIDDQRVPELDSLDFT